MKSERFLGGMAIGIALFAIWVSLDRRARTCSPPQGASNDLDVSVSRDPATGCQYLVTPAGGITPRLGVDGRQVCSIDEAPGQ